MSPKRLAGWLLLLVTMLRPATALRVAGRISLARAPGRASRARLAAALSSSAGADGPDFNTHDEFMAGLTALSGDPLESAGGRIVPFRGSPLARVMVIGEAPGATEDAQGVPFCGRAGKLLDDILRAVDFDLERDVRWAPRSSAAAAAAAHPPPIPTPTPPSTGLHHQRREAPATRQPGPYLRRARLLHAVAAERGPRGRPANRTVLWSVRHEGTSTPTTCHVPRATCPRPFRAGWGRDRNKQRRHPARC